MGNISSTLKLFDAMTGPLSKITQSLNMTISAMQRMQNSADENVKVDRSLLTAKKMLASAEADIRSSIEKANSAQEKFNRSVKNGRSEASGLLSSVKKMGAAYLTFEALKNTGAAMLSGAMKQKDMQSLYAARTGSDALGSSIYSQVTNQALRYGQDVNAAQTGTMSFMSNTMDPSQLVELNKLAMRLSKLNPAEGLDGAVFSLKELMSGDYTSVAERFNISRSALKDSEARNAGLKGDINGFVKGMDKLLNKQNMSQKTFEKMLDSPAAKWNRLVNTFKFNLGKAGQAGLQAFGPFLDMLNKAFDSGSAQSFFNILSTALLIVSSVLSGIGQSILWIWNMIATFGPEVTAMLIALGATYLPMLIKQIWAMSTALNAVIMKWLIANWPIALVVLAVGLLIFILRKLGVTTEEIVGFIGGAFFTMYANIRNLIGLFWNNVLALAEFLVNIFIDPVYAIKKLFYDLTKNIAEFFTNMINGLLSGLNWIIKKVNDVAGTSFGTMGQWSNNWVENFKPTTDKNVVDLSKYRMGQTDLSGAYQTGYKWTNDKMKDITSAIGGITNIGKMPTIKNPSAIDKIGRVGEVGKINDTVDISSEDLKTMRDLAELKSIQNFVSLTPTVQVNTGDIHNDADVDTIIRRIEEALEQEIASSAQGAYV